MAHIKVTKSTTENVYLVAPMFWKDPKWNEWVGLLNDSTVVRIWMTENRVCIENGNITVMQTHLADAVNNSYDKITEEVFFSAFDEAYESMRLSPQVRENAGEFKEREEKEEQIPLENYVD